MSAIWGVVDFKNEALDHGMVRRMEEPLHRYKIDAFRHLQKGAIAMGCGVQYITKESENEVVPIEDEVGQIYLTADCLLSNRKSLIKKLRRDFDCKDELPDGTLIYYAYRKWGEDCAKYLKGAFAFGIYDQAENKLLVYGDQVFERCIYYYFDQEEKRGYFSTLIQPIIKGAHHPFEINETYISDSLAINGLRMAIEPNYTIYEKINKVEAGCYMKITADGAMKIRYYDPVAVKGGRKMSPAKCGGYFKKRLEKAVEEACRCKGNVGVSLSSGLDSSTIAGIAASQLRNRNEPLYSYTFVPVEGYQYNRKGDNGRIVADETKGVQSIADMHPNIKAHFIDNEGKDAFSQMADLVDLLEVPYKAMGNIPAIYNLCEEGAKDGCKVILTGQYGNVTLSQGFAEDALYDGVVRLQWGKVLRRMNDLHRRYGLSRKKMLYKVIQKVFSVAVCKLGYGFRRDLIGESYINRDFAKEMAVAKRLKKSELNYSGAKGASIADYHRYMYDLFPLSQMGELMTKIGLATGVILRDPTKDCQVIEYCRELGMDCFFNDGLDRWLVRGNMAEYVPQEILLNVSNRGLQSADTLYRINQQWAKIKPSLRGLCMDEKMARYIDTQKIEAFFEQHEAGFEEMNEFGVEAVMYIGGIGRIV